MAIPGNTAFNQMQYAKKQKKAKAKAAEEKKKRKQEIVLAERSIPEADILDAADPMSEPVAKVPMNK